MSSRAETRA